MFGPLRNPVRRLDPGRAALRNGPIAWTLFPFRPERPSGRNLGEPLAVMPPGGAAGRLPWVVRGDDVFPDAVE